MGTKTFKSLSDFARHGCDMAIRCANPNCQNRAVIDTHDLEKWARCWRWPTALEAGHIHRKLRCSKCGRREPSIKPTWDKVTVTEFFPADERGWKKLVQRIRR